MSKVTLYAELVPYEGYCTGVVRKIKATGKDELSAMKVLLNHCSTMVSPLDVEEMIQEANDDGVSISIMEIVDRIADDNGNGCDNMFTLVNKTTGEVYIDDGGWGREEEYSDED